MKRGPWPQWGRVSPDELYGGMQRSQLARLKELESEASNAIGSREMPNNQRLRRAVSDLTLDKLILTEAAKGV